MFVIGKARRSALTLSDLEAYLVLNGAEPAKWLAREVKTWGEFDYADLEAAILDGRLEELIDWQGRYAAVINEVLSPLWLKAIEAASKKATRGKVILSDSNDDVKLWLARHGAELVTRLSEESKKAIATVLFKWSVELLQPRVMAYQIRPLIGLNERQALANARYRDKLYQKLLDNGMRPSAASERASAAAVRYASKQHRYRAETIVNTELAFAYNHGAHEGVKRAITEGHMKRCAMIWSTAGTHRVCGRCMELKDTIVGYTDEQGVQIPPLHPRCRCAIVYREEKPKPDALAAPPARSTPASSANPEIISLPNATGACKTFEELKLYWAENYNVKIAESVAELNFEAVQAALNGAEAVLKEFPPAGLCLKEFDVCSYGLMSTLRGRGKIFFNPEIFSSAEKVAAEIAAGVESGFYPKNMTIAGAGAHEMIHIVEDWLRNKHAENTATALRILPRKLIRKAYQKAISSSEGEGKTIDQMRSEISTYAAAGSLSECLADGGCDYILNNTQAALLSREIWVALKEEIDKMHLFSEMRLGKYKKEEILGYGVFDAEGCLVGVKDDAPAEFKEAYEHDKKIEEEWEKLGID